MKIPEDIEIIDWPTSYMWFDDDGVLYSKPKSDAPQNQSRKEMEEQMDRFRELIGGEKICMIIQSEASSKPVKKEDRDWISNELNSVVKALAIVYSTPLARMLANLFFGLKPPAYPTKFCANEKEAKEWIKQYL